MVMPLPDSDSLSLLPPPPPQREINPLKDVLRNLASSTSLVATETEDALVQAAVEGLVQFQGTGEPSNDAVVQDAEEAVPTAPAVTLTADSTLDLSQPVPLPDDTVDDPSIGTPAAAVRGRMPRSHLCCAPKSKKTHRGPCGHLARPGRIVCMRHLDLLVNLNQDKEKELTEYYWASSGDQGRPWLQRRDDIFRAILHSQTDGRCVKSASSM